MRSRYAMTDTEESDKIEVETSTADFERAGAALDGIERVMPKTNEGQDDPEENIAKAWVIKRIAEERRYDALAGQAAGARSRERKRKLLAPPGDEPGPSAIVKTTKRTAESASSQTHRATLAFIAGTEKVAHSEEEDLHPAQLDPTSADLERALDASTPLQRRVAEREARDA